MLHTLRVTQEDIDHGERGECRTCPVALSGARCITGFDWATHHLMVGLTILDIRILDGVVVARAFLPEIATQFIADFDYRREVHPIEFPVWLVPWD